MKKLLIIMSCLLIFIGCGKRKVTADEVMEAKTEKMMTEASRRTGLPNITNFTEKRFVKMLYELRDKEVKTYSYYLDMTGKLHFLCNSIGFGIPASVQYSNPKKLTRSDLGAHYGQTAMPQAEPNGVFMPDSLSATYVMCTTKEGKIHPVYFEPKLIVSPFKLVK